MKRLIFILLTLLFMLSSIYGQEKELKSMVEELVQEPPAPPEVSRNYFEFRKLDKAQEEKLLNKLDKETREMLLDIKKYDEDRYKEILFQSRFRNLEFALPRIEKEKNKNKREKKIWGLEVQTEALGLKFQNDKSTRSLTEAKLKDKLNELFELREQSRKEEVESLEKDLEELKGALIFRQKNKKEIIDRRMMELTGKGKYLDWD